MAHKMTHAQICEELGVPVSSPASCWLPYAVQLTYIEVYVGNRRVRVYGGARACGACGFGVDTLPSATTHPKKRADGGCPNCGSLDGVAPETKEEGR